MAETTEKLRIMKRKHVGRLLNWSNVTAVDINYKTVRAQKTNDLCLVIWVREKKPESEIPAGEILPKEIDGFAVDVFEGEIKLGEGFSWPATLSQTTEQSQMRELTAQEVVKLRPLDTLRGGDSLGPMTFDGAGTLGYFVKQGETVGILSNAHVVESAGTELISPGKLDGGTADDYIGTVKKVVLTTAVDCGHAPLRSNIDKFLLKDGTSVTGTEKAAVGTKIKFYGRTSGLVNQGEVTSVDWSGTISGHQVDNQILFFASSAKRGNSGSLLINRENNKAIGLYFADDDNNMGLANHIGDVLNALNVEIAI